MIRVVFYDGERYLSVPISIIAGAPWAFVSATETYHVVGPDTKRAPVVQYDGKAWRIAGTLLSYDSREAAFLAAIASL